MSTVHICLEDIFGVAVDCEVIFSPGDAPFFDGSSVAISGACSVRLDADGNGSVMLLPGRYAVRFSGITSTTDTLIIVVPNDEATYELPSLVIAGNWILPFRDFLQCAKNLADVADPAAAFASIKQAATATASGVVQLATQAEVNAGSDPAKAVTPATLAGAMGSRSATAYTLQSAAFTAVAGGQYALDTTAGSFAVTIDAALPVGKYIDFADAFGTWNANPPTFLRNGMRFEGSVVDYTDSAQGTFLRIVNVGGAKGLRILESGTKPHNLTAPTITGQYVGQAFTATTGSWTGSPTAYLYQWQCSTDGETWVDIAGATAGSYVPGSGLLGAFVRVVVSAANANGTGLPVPSTASVALTAAPYPAGAIAAWHLDETSGTRADATGNSDDLSDTNGTGFVAGVLGNAAYFDPNNTAHLSGSIPALTGSFSICGWVKLVSENQNVPGPASVFQLADGQGKISGIRLQWGDGHGGFNIQSSTLGSSDSALSDPAFAWGTTDFHHFICTYDNSVEGQCTCNVYVDGNIVPSAMVVFAANFVPTSLILGAQINDSWQVFGDCAIDEVVIFSRLLSAHDAVQLFNNGQGLAYSV